MYNKYAQDNILYQGHIEPPSPLTVLYMEYGSVDSSYAQDNILYQGHIEPPSPLTVLYMEYGSVDSSYGELVSMVI